MEKKDGKDKYRKKKYTPQKKATLNHFSESLLKDYQKRHSQSLQLHNELQIYKRNPDLSQEDKSLIEKVTLTKEAFEILVDACKKGATIDLQHDLHYIGRDYLPDLPPLDFPWWASIEERLHKDFPGLIKKYEERRKAFIKKEKAIKSVVRFLCNLPPISEDIKHHPDTSVEYISVTDFNNDLMNLQSRLKTQMDIYLDFLAMEVENSHMFMLQRIKNPRDWMRKNPGDLIGEEEWKKICKKKNPIINEIIITLVDTFKNIGYSDKQAYMRTGKLLHCFHPHLVPDPDPDLVRQRYTYHQKKSK